MFHSISRDKLYTMLKNHEEFKLVDVLSRDSFNSTHIEGAINIPLENFEDEASKFLNKDEKIVVYCGSQECTSSEAASEKLSEMGYFNVFDYAGGLKDWKDSGMSLSGGEPKISGGCDTSSCK